MEMTSAEIINELKKEKDQSKIEELTMLFETADLVKFAKYSATPLESDTCLNHMTDFVNESYAHYQDMKAKEAAAQPENAIKEEVQNV